MSNPAAHGAADDAARWRETADRWQRRTVEREQKKAAVLAGDYIGADSRERLVHLLHRNQLWADALAPGASAGTAPAEGVVDLTRPLRPEDISNRLVERSIGSTRDLLSVEFFEMGLLAARCVGMVTTREATGTGFLVAPGLMLTNEHVLRSAAEAAESDIQMDFEANRVGPSRPAEIFRLLPEVFFLADPELDFALVAVDDESQNGTRLNLYDVLPLIGEEGKVVIGLPVNVVQHPGGRAKQVVFRNNQLVDLPEGHEMGAFFHYEADTEKGSSGAPVFNDFWEVVALHHRGVALTDDQGQLVDAAGKVLRAGDEENYVWKANEGVRVSRIVAAVEKADLPEHMQTVRDEALDSWRLRGQPSAAVRAPLSPVEAAPRRGGQESITVRRAASSQAGGIDVETTVGPADGGQEVEITVPIRLRIRVEAGPATEA